MVKKAVHKNQLFLDFEAPKAPEKTEGAMDFDQKLRVLLNDTIKEYSKKSDDHDRYKLASDMSKLAEADITKSMIDSWTAPSRAEWRFPLSYLPAFTVATGDKRVLEAIARLSGFAILAGEEEFLWAQFGRLEHAEQEIKRQKKAVKQQLNQEGK